MTMRRPPALALAALLWAGAITQAQQVPDSAFRPSVARPAFPGGRGPSLCLDEGHFNFHTLEGRFLAFGRLARLDGFRVSPLRARFSDQALAACRVLVIANAQPNDDDWSRYPAPTPSAFAPDEVAAVHAWVARGGALLLIADHMPLAGAAASLAAAFGVRFTDGFAFPRIVTPAGRDSAISSPTIFRRSDGTLAPHVIVRGRDSTESVSRVRSFTGQAFQGDPAALSPILILPHDYVSLEPRIAWRFGADTPMRDVGGWLQGATLQVGRGRVAFFGEAAMFSAQVNGPQRRPMGMNAPMAEENAQLVLNVLRWLVRVLDG